MPTHGCRSRFWPDTQGATSVSHLKSGFHAVVSMSMSMGGWRRGYHFRKVIGIDVEHEVDLFHQSIMIGFTTYYTKAFKERRRHSISIDHFETITQLPNYWVKELSRRLQERGHLKVSRRILEVRKCHQLTVYMIDIIL
ncbi:hypothetical protein J6590_060864 [Homalodisca vitripennis]|nr:hypothetical protein J6590_060864 [Homalodisca vitripennis]